MANTVQSRALSKAADLLGGRKSLADRLGVTVADIEKWTLGTRPTPREIFLRVVELILDELPPPDATSSEPPESPPRRSSAASSQRDLD
jgi:hypothetical protein